MKTTRNCFASALGALALGGMFMSPLGVSAQEADPAKPATVEPTGKSSEKAVKTANQREIRKRVQRKVADLHRAGKHDEARKLVEKIQKNPKKPADETTPEKSKPDAPEEKTPERARVRRIVAETPPVTKLQHLRQAAFHLKAAGYEPQADKAVAEAKRIEVESKRKAAQPDPAKPADANAALRGEMMELRRDLKELRREVRMLKVKAHAGQRAPAGPQGIRRPWTGKGSPPVVPQRP